MNFYNIVTNKNAGVLTVYVLYGYSGGLRANNSKLRAANDVGITLNPKHLRQHGFLIVECWHSGRHMNRHSRG